MFEFQSRQQLVEWAAKNLTSDEKFYVENGRKRIRTTKKVYVFDQDRNFIKSYRSLYNAAFRLGLGKDRGTIISSYARSGRCYRNKYYFSFNPTLSNPKPPGYRKERVNRI